MPQGSKEAKFVSLASCVRGDLWFNKFAAVIRRVLDGAIVLSLFDICTRDDNRARITHAANHTLSDRSKDIDLKYWFSVDNVQKRNVRLRYTRTEDVVADMFIKNLSEIQFCSPVKLASTI